MSYIVEAVGAIEARKKEANHHVEKSVQAPESHPPVRIE
jgi:hypothetical protein